MLTHGSLFSGIGGFDLAAQWAGWENIFHCEWNPFGQRILKHYWPQSKSYNDITKTDFTSHRGAINIISGGFPCQPYSQAGKRLGKEDERHLWPEMLRAIREIQPNWVVGENVRGLVNWDAGLVFHEVQTQLEVEGYEVTPFLLPAAGINAPHERYRIWFIAHAKRNNGFGTFAGVNGKTEGLEGVDGEKYSTTGQSCGTNNNDIKGFEQIQRATSDTNNPGRGKGNKTHEGGAPEQPNGPSIFKNDSDANSDRLQGRGHRPDPKRQGDKLSNFMHPIHGTVGKTSHLNPRFVAEMMGFPPNWTELPFLNGETKV